MAVQRGEADEVHPVPLASALRFGPADEAVGIAIH